MGDYNSDSSSPRSSASDVPPPPAAPAAAFVCDDYNHCLGNGAFACDQVNHHRCPGFPGAQVLSHNGFLHPLNNVEVCNWCADFDVLTNQIRIRSVADTIPHNGNLIQLCQGCIRDEMELYWERNGTMAPAGVASAQSIADVDTWPHLPGPSVQNLCICINSAIVRFLGHCHRCRHTRWRAQCLDHQWDTEDMLTERTKPAITGKRLCIRNGGTAQYRISNATRAKRARENVLRVCPCGEPSKPNEPPGQEYILICSGCMGVIVRPQNLPAQYSRANMQPRRRSPRNHAAGTLKRTKGPRKLERRSTWRVNIERGWVLNDPLIGGA